MNCKLNHKFFKKEAFTLVELLSTIVIIALLVGAVVIYIPQFISWSRLNSDKQTLTVLNDALTRYKTQGGGTAAFTLEVTPDLALAKLSQAITWAGRAHQVLKTGQTYPAHSLSAVGTGASYRFIRFNSYVDASNSIQRSITLPSGGKHILSDYYGAKSSDGTYRSPDRIFDNWDLDGFIEAGLQFDLDAYKARNPTFSDDDINIIGDLNLDGFTDGADINAIVDALENPAQYNINYPPQ